MLEESLSLWASMNSWFTPTVFFVLLNLMIGTIAITSSLATQKRHDQNYPQPQLARSPSILQRLKSINLYTYRSQEPTTVSFHQPPDFPTQHNYTHDSQQTQFTRSPSLLQRLKSINLQNYFPSAALGLCQKTLHDSGEENHYILTQSGQEEEPLEEFDGRVDDDECEDKLEQGFSQEPSMDEIYSRLHGEHVNRTKSDTKPASGEVPPKLSKKMKKSASSKSAFSHFKEKDIVDSRRPATVRERKVSVTAEADEEVDAKADDFINRFKQQLKLQRLDSIMRYKNMISRGSAK